MKEVTSASIGDSTRERLIQAGIELFARYGFRGTTTRKICEMVGANNAAVFFYFGSKEKFYETVLDTVAQTIRDDFQPLLQQVAAARAAGGIAPAKAWYLIEQYVDLYIEILKAPETSSVLYLLLQEQLTPANGYRPLARAACQQREFVLTQLLLDYWGLDNAYAATVISRLATGALISLAEHPTFLRTALELDEDTPLPPEAWQDIRGYTLSALRSFVPSMPADGSGQKELTRYREIFEQRENL